MRFFIPFVIYIAVALIAQAGIWMDDKSKIRWRKAQLKYKQIGSEFHKKELAEAAAAYIYKRNLSYYWWFWPITLPLSFVVGVAKAPKSIYNYFKGNKSAYAQARKHMDGEAK